MYNITEHDTAIIKNVLNTVRSTYGDTFMTHYKIKQNLKVIFTVLGGKAMNMI